MSAIEMRQVSEPYIRRRAIHHLEKGYVVILLQVRATPTSLRIPPPRFAPAKLTLNA